MANYGKYLGNRLECREILNNLKEELTITKELIIDFSGVSLITMSFGTELFDSIYSIKNNDEVKIINTSNSVMSIVNFCIKNKRIKSNFIS